MVGTLAACSRTFPDPDCDNWHLEMHYEEGVPVFSLDVPATDGVVARRTFTVARGNDRGPLLWCNSDFRTSDPLWEVVGRFDEVTYLQVPEDAQETFNANRDRTTPGPRTALQEGQLYVADVFLNPDQGQDGTGCIGQQIVWIHGAPDTITTCVDVPETTP